jgi:hypothetical protein
MMGDLLSDDFDKVSVTEFFGALVAMDEAESEVIELNATSKAGSWCWTSLLHCRSPVAR